MLEFLMKLAKKIHVGVNFIFLSNSNLNLLSIIFLDVRHSIQPFFLFLDLLKIFNYVKFQHFKSINYSNNLSKYISILRYLLTVHQF